MGRPALGKGLGALIRGPVDSPSATSVADPLADRGVLEIDVELIEPSPHQPRTRFNQAALEELAGSIRASGIIQPVVVRPVRGRFQLLAGERRWRAAQRAGLRKIPAVIREVPEEQAFEISLIENIQREDLNAVEQARAFERLLTDFRLTQEDVANRTGKDRATVANTLRLLKLEPRILGMIEEGKLSAGHGRALLSVEDSELRWALARRAARGAATVRQVERLATRRLRKRSDEPGQHVDPNVKAALEELQQELGMRVELRPARGKRPGQLILEFHDESQLHTVYDRLLRRRH